MIRFSIHAVREICFFSRHDTAVCIWKILHLKMMNQLDCKGLFWEGALKARSESGQFSWVVQCGRLLFPDSIHSALLRDHELVDNYLADDKKSPIMGNGVSFFTLREKLPNKSYNHSGAITAQPLISLNAHLNIPTRFNWTFALSLFLLVKTIQL